MSRRLVNLTLDTLDDLPHRCRQCVFWELDPVAGKRACADGGAGFEKEAWVSQTLLEWGSCGKLIYVDHMPAGFAIYAPSRYAPRSLAFPTSPISADAVLLMSVHVVPAFAGGGLGRMLVQSVARDVAKRSVRAIEAFGDARSRAGRAVGGRPSSVEADDCGDGERQHGRRCSDHGSVDVEPREGSAASGCLAPADFFLAVGFRTVRPHPRYPRVRLELRTTLSWKSDVGYALERLLGSMSPEAIFRPAARA